MVNKEKKMIVKYLLYVLINMLRSVSCESGVYLHKKDVLKCIGKNVDLSSDNYILISISTNKNGIKKEIKHEYIIREDILNYLENNKDKLTDRQQEFYTYLLTKD